MSDGREHCLIPHGKLHPVAVRWSIIKSSTLKWEWIRRYLYQNVENIGGILYEELGGGLACEEPTENGVVLR